VLTHLATGNSGVQGSASVLSPGFGSRVLPLLRSDGCDHWPHAVMTVRARAPRWEQTLPCRVVGCADSVGEPDENEPRIHDSSDQHRDQRGNKNVDPVLVPEHQDDRGYDQQ
jgi:hypothetical protein